MNDLFKNRRSVRKFTDRPVTDSQIYEIICAGMVAASGCNTKGYQLVLVKNKSMLEKLSKMGKWVDFLKGCSYAVVITAKDYPFWIEDCTLVASNIMHEAVNQGLGCCWADIKDGMVLDKTDRVSIVQKLLGIPKEQHVLCAIAIGNPDQKVKPHSESDYDEKKIHMEKW